MMHSTGVFSSLICALNLVSGSPISSHSNYAVKDYHPIPRRWTEVQRAPADYPIKLTIGLKQGYGLELERNLLEISDPTHGRYGQYMTKEEVEALVRPTEETSELVHGWLQGFGIESHMLEYSTAKDFIRVALPVAMIEKLLGTKYSVYEHEEGAAVVRTPEFSLPLYLHEHIETIQPTNSFYQARTRPSDLKKRANAFAEDENTLAKRELHADGAIPAACDNYYFPSGVPTRYTELGCVRYLYGTQDYVVKANGTNQMGIANFLGETSRRADIKNFLQWYRSEAKGAEKDMSIVSVNGGHDDQSRPSGYSDWQQFGDEAAEYMIGTAWPTHLTAWNVGGKPPFWASYSQDTNWNEPWFNLTTYLLGLDTIPQTIAANYMDEEQTVPPSYAKTVCDQFKQLGARGVSVLVPSGNIGIGPGGFCLPNTGPQDGTQGVKFLPEFPASCPWVTAVGGTMNVNPEIAAAEDLSSMDSFHSGAGFSDYFPQPAWQTAVVDAYVKTLPKKLAKQYQGKWNPKGRAYPDIAAQAYNVDTAWADGSSIMLGTDVATPIAAGVFALVNDALIAAGKKPLGFLNPFIYAVGNKAFTDVLKGESAGCSFPGFPAKKGWDAVTGFGSPRFKDLVALAMSYQS